MRVALALCLLTSSAFPAAAEIEEAPPVMATPFVLLNDHPGCSGPGKIAFQVDFDVKGAPARLGFIGQDKEAARTCTIRTRKGAKVVDIPIPCPDVPTSDLAANAHLDDLPRAADISGKFIACTGLSDVSLLEGSWTIRASVANSLEVSGDLTSPDLTVLFEVSAAQLSGAGLTTPKPGKPVLALVWDGVDVSVTSMPDAALEISAYVALAPTEEPYWRCPEGDCNPLYSTHMSWIVRSMGDPRINDVIKFVEGW